MRCWRLFLSTVVAVTTVWSAACGRPVQAIDHAHQTVDALARAVLSALAQSDQAALRALALDEREFLDHVWPDLPAARPERNLPFSFVWGDLYQKSQASLSRTLAARGGRSYDLIGVRFIGGATPYERYVVHRQAELTVRDGAGVEERLRLFGSVLAKDGRYKVFSYVVD